MEQIHSFIIISAFSLICGIMLGVIIMVFAVRQRKSSKTLKNAIQESDLLKLNEQIKWLEGMLQKLMGLSSIDAIGRIFRELKEKDLTISSLKISLEEWQNANQRLGDEIFSLEEANKIKYESGFVNGRLAAIKKIGDSLSENMKVGGKFITGRDMIQESAIVVKKNIIVPGTICFEIDGAVIIYGPQGCGKSKKKFFFADYYRKNEILDEYYPPMRPNNNQIIFTNIKPIRAPYNILPNIGLVISYEDALKACGGEENFNIWCELSDPNKVAV